MNASLIFAALGLDRYAKITEAFEKTVRPTPPPPPAAPPPPPRWKFAVVPDEAITRCTKGSARLALHGSLEGYGVWVKTWRFRRHADLGRILTLRDGMTFDAEKREKGSHGWRTTDTKTLDRSGMLAQFAEVNVGWDDLEAEEIKNDDPDWQTDGRSYVKDHIPAHLEKETRPIADELLMDSEEDSWKEMDGEN